MKLDLNQRPYVAFDAANKQHRRWFSEFHENRTWGHCPVRFVIPDDCGDLVSMIRSRLIDFYVGKEFGKTEA